ncbi:MAG: single-stranded-DNA-specific exonuclease RecJ [Coprobacter sp.]|nr:single-stranded-DNA-specific exonuclease RecJ [Coprobacter sp.]
MVSKWNYVPLTKEDEHIQERLAETLSISPAICTLLVQRGVKTVEDARKFFRPQLADLYDPFLLKDMDKAVSRLNKAMGAKEKILIYGDYDVDGTTAVALVYKFLNNFYSNLDYYIPDRYDEGYGISIKGIDYAAENGITLIIALDCGIKAVEKVAYAQEKGIDFIICDHHVPDEKLPEAVAVLDAKRDDDTYPYEHLSGCGVGFKFMEGFARSNGIDVSQYLFPLLDLVAVSIASDIVPITGENRILAYHGLRCLNANPSLGLKGIIDICGLRGKEIGISDIVFKIGPRINASGRMQSGKEAVDLLVSKDAVTAQEKSQNINQYNETRKELDKKVTEEARQLLELRPDFNDRKSIVIYNAEWHKGIIGIVASRLTELYYRPSVVLTYSEANNLVTGSARSVQGFDVYKAIESCRDLLENFGGHTYAAGLSLRQENIDEFIERFETYVAENILQEQTVQQIDIDMELGFEEITADFYNWLKQFNPMGPGNLKPVFSTRGVYDYNSRLVGRNQEHLKLEIRDGKSGTIMGGIAFGQGEEHFSYLRSGAPVGICYTVEENDFKGNKTIQLQVKDILHE